MSMRVLRNVLTTDTYIEIYTYTRFAYLGVNDDEPIYSSARVSGKRFFLSSRTDGGPRCRVVALTGICNTDGISGPTNTPVRSSFHPLREGSNVDALADAFADASAEVEYKVETMFMLLKKVKLCFGEKSVGGRKMVPVSNVYFCRHKNLSKDVCIKSMFCVF
jgi:hypothetical protein